MLLPFINEALHDLGLWAVAPLIMGMTVYEIRRKLNVKDDQIEALRREIHELQEKRLHDAREMIRIAESGTAATASRTESDLRFADLIESVLRRNSNSSLFGWRR